jgi:hypothetical protein
VVFCLPHSENAALDNLNRQDFECYLPLRQKNHPPRPQAAAIDKQRFWRSINGAIGVAP